MPKILYTLGIYLYGLAIRLAAPFSEKAKKWLNGRKDWEQSWRKTETEGRPILWFHCASLGEFEMIRPLMKQIKADYPQTFLLTSFFSPSGYEQVRKDPLPDAVHYLPLDTPSNMKKLMSIFSPKLIIQVKNEFWLNWMDEIHQRKIPLILIAANITAEKSIMRAPLKYLYLKLLGSCRHIFTQNEASTRFLSQFLPENILSTSQDTRFDRVKESRENHHPIKEIEDLTRSKFVWIAGSTYQKDEEMILKAFEHFKDGTEPCLVLAPHEIDHQRMDNWVNNYPDISIKYSEWDKKTPVQVLWIDHIGMLSRLYRYAHIAFIGGAWNHGLHNILEAATFGSPIIFGPKYENFPEAMDLIAQNTAFSYQNLEELINLIGILKENHQLREEIYRKNRSYIDNRGGASAQIYQYLLDEQLLN